MDTTIMSSMKQRTGADWRDRGRQRFVLLCSYYMLATYLIPSSGIIQPYSLAYFAIVLPGGLYIASSWRALIQPSGFLVRLWWLFIITVIGVAAVQGNASLFYNGTYLGLLAIVIINTGGYLRAAELNGLFLVAIIGSVVIYYLGMTDYGFLPGQAAAPACHGGMSFRVSLFRVPSESAALSLFVLLWNIFLPPGGARWVRWLVIALALYFIVLSGIRTAIVGLMIVSPILLYRLLPGPRGLSKIVLALLLPISLATFLLMQLSKPPGDSWFGDFLSGYVLRTGTCAAVLDSQAETPDSIKEVGSGVSGFALSILASRDLSANWLEQTFNRHCSAKYQWELFLKQPLTGNQIVKPDLNAESPYVGCDIRTLKRYCDACVLATYWLSKGGLAGVLFISLYLATLWMAFRRNSLMGVAALIVFGLLMQGWGVMFTPYNFNFYMLISLVPLIGINGPIGKDGGGRHGKKSALGEEAPLPERMEL